MELFKEFAKKGGFDLDELRTEFYAHCEGAKHAEMSIRNSMSFIKEVCMLESKSVWDVVQEMFEDFNKDESIPDFSAKMTKASLLLAWGELEKNHEKWYLQMHKNAKVI